MELLQLRYFVQVAKHASFTRAAEDLLVTQPSLSRAIAKLEVELGQPLFERLNRGVALTETGELFLRRAGQILDLVDDTKSQVTDDDRTGTIRLAAIPTIAPYFLPGLLQEFAQERPEAKVVVEEDLTSNLLQRAVDGEIDVAVVALPISMKYVEVERLFVEELFLAMPSGHPLADRKQITVADVEPYPIVLLGEGHCLSDSIVALCRQKSFHPVRVGKTSQLTTVQELVALGHGVSLIPAMAKVLDRSDRRIYRSFTDRKPMREIAMVWNPYRFQSRLLKTFRLFLMRYADRFSNTVSTGLPGS